MGSTTKTTQKNDYKYFTPPATADVNALREMKAQVNPTIPYHYAARKEELGNSFQNPLGAYTSPAVRDAAARSSTRALGQEQAAATAGAYSDVDTANFQRQFGIAGFTNPRLMQTGMQGTQYTPFNWMGALTGGVAGAASV